MRPYICKSEKKYRSIGLLTPISYEGTAYVAFGFWFFVIGIEFECSTYCGDGWHLLKDLFK